MKNKLLKHSWLFLLTISAFAKTNSSSLAEYRQDNHGKSSLTLDVNQSKKLSLTTPKVVQKYKVSENKKLPLFPNEFDFQLYKPPKNRELIELSNEKTKSLSFLYQFEFNNMTFQLLPF